MYHQGQWLATCDRCGFNKLNTDLRKEWTGLMVCAVECFDKRHPQEFVRGVPDKQAPPWVRPEPEPVFLEPGDVTPDDL